jgi:hypothetical protein
MLTGEKIRLSLRLCDFLALLVQLISGASANGRHTCLCFTTSSHLCLRKRGISSDTETYLRVHLFFKLLCFFCFFCFF